MPRTITAHCATCGDRSRLNFPAYAPICCTQRCAAQRLLILIDVGAERHCALCGEFGCEGECERECEE